MANKIDSNLTGLYIAEEVSLKTLPGTTQQDGIWYGQEPNSYSDFGGNFTNVARTPIKPSRQVQKGVLTDLEASGGFNSDFTQNNMQRLLQGFFFADAHEKPDTKAFNSTAVTITGVTGTSKTYAAAAGLGNFKTGHLIVASGFTNSSNNGLDVVASATATTVVGAAAKVDEAVPPAAARIEAVGFQFPSADVSLASTAAGLTLTSVATDLTTLGLNVGEWTFIGGDAAANKFTTNAPGYARIKSIATHAIVFDDTTWSPSTEAGTGKTIQIFFGRFIRNESASNLIKRRSYQLQRQLGSDGVGTQTEYLLGAIPNEFTLNVPEANKLATDLTFVAMDYKTRTGTEGPKPGTYNAAGGEDAYNTSSDIYRMKMAIHDPLNMNQSALFAYVTDAKITVNNGVAPNKAIGVLGAFDASTGDFVVSGSLTAYFSTVSAVSAIRNNADVGFNAIFARENGGFVFDIPLMAIGGGRLSVEKDNPVKLPIDMSAAENWLGFTFSGTFFSYLPTVAMPV